jgi:hypothetical protein
MGVLGVVLNVVFIFGYLQWEACRLVEGKTLLVLEAVNIPWQALSRALRRAVTKK